MGAVTSIMQASKFRNQPHPMMGKEAQVLKSVTAVNDPCLGKRGTVILVTWLTEGDLYKNEWLFTLRFETPRGRIIQTYIGEELKFV